MREAWVDFQWRRSSVVLLANKSLLASALPRQGLRRVCSCQSPLASLRRASRPRQGRPSCFFRACQALPHGHLAGQRGSPSKVVRRCDSPACGEDGQRHPKPLPCQGCAPCFCQPCWVACTLRGSPASFAGQTLWRHHTLCVSMFVYVRAVPVPAGYY